MPAGQAAGVLGSFGGNDFQGYLARDGGHRIVESLDEVPAGEVFQASHNGARAVGCRRAGGGQWRAVGAGDSQPAGFGEDQEPVPGGARVTGVPRTWGDPASWVRTRAAAAASPRSWTVAGGSGTSTRTAA